MPKLPGRKAIPWMLLLEAALIAREHWGFLEDRERRELTRIVGKSKGRPGNLSSQERSELLRIVRKLEPFTAGRRMLPFNGGVSKSRLRGRHQ
jgi:hypothetical protein